MAELNFSQAVDVSGVSESTFRKYLKTGKLSAKKNMHGRWVFDNSELIRVFGEPKNNKKEPSSDSQKDDLIQVLKEQIYELKENTKKALEREEKLMEMLKKEQSSRYELEQRMLPPAQEKKGLFKRIFG